jgi:hypothetical protein
MRDTQIILFRAHFGSQVADLVGAQSGYRTPIISRPSQRVTVIAVTGQSVMPRLRRSR